MHRYQNLQISLIFVSEFCVSFTFYILKTQFSVEKDAMNEYYERCLIRDAAYPMSVEDGLALSILKNHTVREAEALLTAVVADETEAKATLKRVCGLIHATA